MDFLSALARYFQVLFATIGDTLRLNPAGLNLPDEFRWSVPIGIAVLGGMSTMLGQSAILGINRVNRWRSIFTMIGSGLGLVLTGVLQAVFLLILSLVFVGTGYEPTSLLTAVLTSFAPYCFGFLILLPYTGPGIARILSVWQLLALWTLICPALGIERGTGLLLAMGAWAGTLLTDWLYANSPLHLRERFFKLFTGKNMLTSNDLLNDVKLSDRTKRADS